MRIKATLLALGLLCLVDAVPACAQVSGSGRSPQPQSPEVLASELRLLREQVRLHPEDCQLQYRIGEVLRNLGRTSEATVAYASATKLSPDLYVAYHQLSGLSSDPEQLDEAIARLTARCQEKPDELMGRVALSEMLEKRGNFQLAARVLIDITYANKVPEKYKAKVSGRIHHLLALAKSAQQQEVTEVTVAEEQLDVVPSPLPAQPSKRSIASAKMKDAREVKGVGKVPLLP